MMSGVEFLARLFPSDALVELRAFRTDRQGPAIQFFARNGREITLRSNGNGNGREISSFLAEQIRKQNNVYFGCATRKILSTDQKLCGDKKHCGEVVALWIDIDFQDVSEEEARRRLAQFPFPPSIVIRSGGGLHCYWLLKEPVAANGFVESILRGIAVTLGADTACAEIARVLRVPATPNFKFDPPREVTLEIADFDRRYSLSEFEMFATETSARNSTGEFLGVQLPPGVNDEAALRILATKIAFNVRRVANGETWLDYHGLLRDGQRQGCLIKNALHGSHTENPRECSFALKDDRIAHFCFHESCRRWGQDSAGIRGLEEAGPGDFESKTRSAIRGLGLATELLGEPEAPRVEVSEPASEPAPASADFSTNGTGKTPPTGSPLTLIDMPEACMVGRLSDIYYKRLSRFPVALAWPTLATCAGTLANQNSQLRANLFTALCGPVGSGKTVIVEQVAYLLGIGEPTLEETMAGSGEGLLQKLENANGTSRLYWPDELSHTFQKAGIENSTFAQILNKAFGRTAFNLTVSGRKVIPANVVLSIIGGLVTDQPSGIGDNFDECFNSATTGGLYDRFLFGRCPQPYRYEYRPIEGGIETYDKPKSVAVDSQVWEMLSDWKREWPELGRIGELSLRVAAICVGFDGGTLLRAVSEYSLAAKAFAEYQLRFRAAMKPNAGTNDDAKCAVAVLRKLKELGGRCEKRTLMRRIHYERFGPGVFKRCGDHLMFNGQIEREIVGSKTKPTVFWVLADEEGEG